MWPQQQQQHPGCFGYYGYPAPAAVDPYSAQRPPQQQQQPNPYAADAGFVTQPLMQPGIFGPGHRQSAAPNAPTPGLWHDQQPQPQPHQQQIQGHSLPSYPHMGAAADAGAHAAGGTEQFDCAPTGQIGATSHSPPRDGPAAAGDADAAYSDTAAATEAAAARGAARDAHGKVYVGVQGSVTQAGADASPYPTVSHLAEGFNDLAVGAKEPASGVVQVQMKQGGSPTKAVPAPLEIPGNTGQQPGTQQQQQPQQPGQQWQQQQHFNIDNPYPSLGLASAAQTPSTVGPTTPSPQELWQHAEWSQMHSPAIPRGLPSYPTMSPSALGPYGSVPPQCHGYAADPHALDHFRSVPLQNSHNQFVQQRGMQHLQPTHAAAGPQQHAQGYHAPAAAQQQQPAARKRALLVACTYKDTKHEVLTTASDVEATAAALTQHFGFPREAIVVLRDDGREQRPELRSTKSGILRGIEWLMSDLSPGTSLFFQFCGNGSQQPAADRYETDGLDETIWPSDFKKAGVLVDNDLNTLLIRPLPNGAVLHSVIDANYSGSVLDLPFSAEWDRKATRVHWEKMVGPSKERMAAKGTCGGFAVQIGACRDSQLAADQVKGGAGGGSGHGGAATQALLAVLDNACQSHGSASSLTYKQLLQAMTESLHEATKTACANAAAADPGLVAKLIFGKRLWRESQVPVLSCSHKLNLDEPLRL